MNNKDLASLKVGDVVYSLKDYYCPKSKKHEFGIRAAVITLVGFKTRFAIFEKVDDECSYVDELMYNGRHWYPSLEKMVKAVKDQSNEEIHEAEILIKDAKATIKLIPVRLAAWKSKEKKAQKFIDEWKTRKLEAQKRKEKESISRRDIIRKLEKLEEKLNKLQSTK